MQLPFSRVLFAVGMPIFLFGAFMAPAWKLAGWLGGDYFATIEFPLGDPRDVAVDSRGRIYVADSVHSRVQRYSPEGEFQRGWFVPTSGVFALRTTAANEVMVATARANKLLTYTGDGDLLDGRYCMKEDRYREYAEEQDTAGPYAVRRGLFPHVVDTRTGEAVVTTHGIKRLLLFPFPALLYAAVGIAFLGASELRRRYEQAH
jgi:hypothetical protein